MSLYSYTKIQPIRTLYQISVNTLYLIGLFWSMSANIVLKHFMNVRKGLQISQNIEKGVGKNQ